MLKHIKTSKENKEVVSKLTRKFNLGAENTIARIAISYSLSKDRKLSLEELSDSQGKEYAKEVLFGEYIDYYTGMIALHYSIHISNKDLARYVKLHLDDGLRLINSDFQEKDNIDGFDFLTDLINKGLTDL
ncbi:DNA sulfur modification protein DndE [Salegentibacter sp. 24]|uniref:DndE family protein n=1 Tax=Salegentibacter sp. 24 TaxID=2183986 RepID=UPI00105EE79F|nr:DndE family protein [Salegentibacter sp. 24]TDN87060.1 DNA sulfur modification protein DndE [Salegentibacter sp. 24]